MTVVGDDVRKDDMVPPMKPEGTPAEKPEGRLEDKPKKKEGMFDDIDSPTKAPDGEDAEDVAGSARLPGYMSGATRDRTQINSEQYDPEDLVITAAEKAAFIDAMVTGERYRQECSIYGGRIHLVLRSRTAAETHAMYAYIRHVLSSDSGAGIVEGDMAFIPLVAQVEELNGTRFPEMKAPLTYEESDGKEVPPGWLEDFKAWKSKPEGLTSAVMNRIQLFEYKYWTMVKEASNKNFWNSDTSIAG